MLSLLLKIISAAGLVTGLAGFFMEARGLSWSRIPPEYTRHAAVGSLDARLSFVDQALSVDEHEDEIRAARQRTAPAAQRVLEEGYGQLIGSQRAASLRQDMNSRPLRVELGGPLMNVLIESGADVSATRFFYDQLVDVQDVSESLLANLESAARPVNRQPETQAYFRRLIRFQVERLRNRSSIAHLAGIRVLNDLDVPLPPDASMRLASLRQLEPRGLVDDATADRLLARNVAEAEQLLAERQSLGVEGERLLRKSIGEYADMAELKIGPEDPWNVVVGKAISLRQLGRTAEAAAAFARYAEMFGPTDPTAERYAATAQQFTVQLPRLGTDGGVYLYRVSGSDRAAKGDLRVGDIVTSWGGREVSSMPDLLGAVQANPGGTVRVDYFRLKGSRFEPRTTTVRGGGVPGGFMPI